VASWRETSQNYFSQRRKGATKAAESASMLPLCAASDKTGTMKNLLYLVMLSLLLGMGSLARAMPKLNSHPSAVAVIFLDFDGHTVNNSVWNNGNTIESIPSLLTDVQITEIFHRVSEDYRPFNLNITTDSLIFHSAPLNRRMRVIITPTNYWRPGAGGIAWLSSFTSGDDTPCFVFSSASGADQPKEIAEVISHETGHTLGLLHQSIYDSNCSLVSPYHPGTGEGETGWAPIMGNSRTRNLSLWNFGPTQTSCNANQDNLYFITSLNGFGYRADDHSNEIGSATQIAFDVQQFNATGIISRITDRDVFRLDLSLQGNLLLKAIPFSVNASNEGANLDLKLSLLNSSGTILRVYHPESVLNVEIDTLLQQGTYYIIVDGTGNKNTNNDYGSLGSYEIKGHFVFQTNLLPLRSVTLTGQVEKNNHLLNWDIETDEPVQETRIEVSNDGWDFRLLHMPAHTMKKFTYSPTKAGIHYYRIRVTSQSGITKYSNIIKLVHNHGVRSRYIIRSISSLEILIIAENKYEYQIFNHNGVMVLTGMGAIGTNRLNTTTLPRGIYLLRLSGPDGTETKAVIR
jgi:hypothetical protein